MGVDIVEIMEVQPRACVVVEGDFYSGRVPVHHLGPPLSDDDLRALGYQIREPSEVPPNEALGRLAPGEEDAEDDEDEEPVELPGDQPAPAVPTGVLPAAQPNPNGATTRPVRLPNGPAVGNGSMGRTVENPTSSRHAPAPVPPPLLGAAGGQSATLPTDRADGPRMTVTNPTSSNAPTVANGAPNGQGATAAGPRKTVAEASTPAQRTDGGPTSEVSAPAQRPDD